MANDGMREYWNSDQAVAWVRSQASYDTMLAPFADAVIDAAAPLRGERVVDLGCGSGEMSRRAGTLVGPEGTVVGLDISEPMLDLARNLSSHLGQVEFRHCDVQTADLSAMSADLVTSRFGVMFFDDPVAAFANVVSGAAPGGRLAFACWRAVFENEWITVPMGAVIPMVGMPDVPEPGAPGPFQMSDAGFVCATLEAAGWHDVEVAPLDRGMRIGGAEDVDAAVGFLMADGMARRLLEGKPDDVRAEARAALREALVAHHSEGEGVVLGAAAWIVTARLRS